MKRFWWCALGCGLLACADKPPETRPQASTEASLEANVPAERWFVQLGALPTRAGGTQAALDAERATFLAAAAKHGLTMRVMFDYQRLWNGLSVRVAPGDTAVLQQLPGVVRVTEVARVEPAAAVRGDQAQADLASALAQIQGDSVHTTLNITGRNVRVGIIDTGIDYHHPDLGGCLGPACAVVAGHDFVGDAYNADVANSVPVPDEDPVDCAGHGTHVAGIVGARGARVGVAPGVQLGAYRVFGCTGTTDDDLMLAALERADLDNMRVINMSIGSPCEWPDRPVSQAAAVLRSHGVLVVASTGNSGAGWSNAGSPGVGAGVVAVAAVDNTSNSQPGFLLSPDARTVGFNNATGAPAAPLEGTFSLVKAGTPTTTNDLCNGSAGLPGAGTWAGKIGLARRGTCTFREKALNAQAAGAVALVLYNNTTAALSPTVAGTPAVAIPVAALTSTDGALIDGRIAGGATTLTWSSSLVTTPSTTGGLLSTFSSMGPAADLSFKPQITAPGGNIYSTYPVALGSYASLSGTSMAAPMITGSLALMLEARENLAADDAVAMLQGSAAPVLSAATGGTLESPARRGAGLVRLADALSPVAIASPSQLSLGTTGTATSITRSITLRNLGAARTLVATHAAARSISGAVNTPNTAGTEAMGVSFATPSIDLPDHGTATVDLVFTPSAATPDHTLLGGDLVFTDMADGRTLRVPYIAYKGDYTSRQVLVPLANGYPWLSRNTTPFVNQGSGATFTLAGTDIPTVVAHLENHASIIHLHAYESVTGKDCGDVLTLTNVGRSSSATGTKNWTWNGTTTLNRRTAVVPNGTYVLKLQVLRALADASLPSSWETWTSPVITINHP